MGQLLSEPVTTKTTSSIENKQFKVGSSAMQGWRVGILHTQRVHTHERERSKMSLACPSGIVNFHVCVVWAVFLWVVQCRNICFPVCVCAHVCTYVGGGCLHV